MEGTQAVRYHRVSCFLILLSFSLQLGLLFVFEKLGWSTSFSRYSLHFAPNYYIALLFYWAGIHLVLTAVLAGVNAGSYRLERFHNLSRQSYPSWLADYLKHRLVNWLITSIAVVWFYGAVRYSPEHWYFFFWTAIVLFYVAVTLTFHSLFLSFFYTVVPLESGETFERLSLLAARAGISRPKFAILKVGHKTQRTNAVVTGVAGAYRILITDTVLETFTPEEIEAIVAHEIGHQVKHHTTTGLLFLCGLYFFPLWISHLVIPELIHDLSDFAHLPYLLISFWVVSQYLIIFFGVFARTQEESADLFCWNLTGNVAAFVSMMRKLAKQNLMVTQKRVATSHPAVEARIAAAENFMKQQEIAAPSGHSA
jgi:STE24 endopeptidase